MAKNLGGRPPKQNKETVGKLEEAFAIGATVEAAAFYAGIHRDTFYAWMKANPALSDRLQALRQRPILQALKTVSESLKDPNHARWYLEKRVKKEYGNALDVTSDGKAIGPTSEAQKLSDTAIDRFLNGDGNNTAGAKVTPTNPQG